MSLLKHVLEDQKFWTFLWRWRPKMIRLKTNVAVQLGKTLNKQYSEALYFLFSFDTALCNFTTESNAIQFPAINSKYEFTEFFFFLQVSDAARVLRAWWNQPERFLLRSCSFELSTMPRHRRRWRHRLPSAVQNRAPRRRTFPSTSTWQQTMTTLITKVETTLTTQRPPSSQLNWLNWNIVRPTRPPSFTNTRSTCRKSLTAAAVRCQPSSRRCRRLLSSIRVSRSRRPLAGWWQRRRSTPLTRPFPVPHLQPQRRRRRQQQERWGTSRRLAAATVMIECQAAAEAAPPLLRQRLPFGRSPPTCHRHAIINIRSADIISFRTDTNSSSSSRSHMRQRLIVDRGPSPRRSVRRQRRQHWCPTAATACSRRHYSPHPCRFTRVERPDSAVCSRPQSQLTSLRRRSGRRSIIAWRRLHSTGRLRRHRRFRRRRRSLPRRSSRFIRLFRSFRQLHSFNIITIHRRR